MVIAVQSKSVVEVDEEALEFLQAVSHLAAIAVGKAHRLTEEQQFNERMRKAAEAAGDLMKLVLSDAATEPVLRAIEALMSCPVLVIDHYAHTVMVGATPPDCETAQWREAVDSHFRTGGLSSPGSVAADAIQVPGSSGRVLETQVRPLAVDGELVGAIHFVRSGTTGKQADDLLLQNVCFAASVMLMRSVVRTKARADTRAKILRELVGEVRDLDDFRSRALKAGLDSKRPAMLVIVSGKALLHRARTLGEADKLVGFVLRRLFGDCVSVAHGASSLLAWIPVEDGASAAPEALRVVASELNHSLGSMPTISRSEVCTVESDYPSALQACERATLLGERFGRPGLLVEGDFGPHALVLASMPEKDIATFVQRTLGSLEKAGAQSGADLVGTVEAFLRSGCRHQKCADTMSIHVTTLRYRLERLHDLCSIDFDDPDCRFALDLAFRFRQAGTPSGAAQRAVPKAG